MSIRNLPIIFETLADYSKMTSDVDVLTEYARQSLAKQITTQYAGNSHVLKVLTVSGKVEKLIADSIQQTEHGNYLSIDPNDSQAILESMAKEVERAIINGAITNYFMFSCSSDVFTTNDRKIFPSNSNSFL